MKIQESSVHVVLVVICVFLLQTEAGHLGVGLIGPSAPGVVLHGPGSKTALVGPDGSHISGIAAGGTVVAPAQHAGAVSVAAAPGVLGVGVLGGSILAPGSGHEGQYVHDYTEQLYDDGSYKGDYYEGH